MDKEFDTGIYNSIRETLIVARKKVYSTVNTVMVEAYWAIGKQIADAQGDRAEYGKNLMQYLSEKLTIELSWSHYRLSIAYNRCECLVEQHNY